MLGTSISDLNKQEYPSQYGDMRNLQDMTQVNYNANQNLQYEQGHNAAHQMHQAQQMPYYTMPNMPNQGYISPKEQQRMQQEALDMEELTKDINNHLPDENFSAVGDLGEERNAESNSNLLSGIPHMLRDPLIILIWFIILSQPVVKDTLGRYLTQINPGADCKVSFAGIFIYGLILAILFALTKKFI
jgi:hypothetical protein